MDMYFTVIDEDKQLGSCKIAEIPKELAELLKQNIDGHTLEELTFFYDDKSNYIVLNEENKLFELYKALVLDLLECTCTQLLNMIPNAPASVRNAISIVSNVLKIRAQTETK